MELDIPEIYTAKLLLIDDDPGAIQILNRALSAYSELRFATDGVQAVMLAQQQRPDVILLDADMPGMSGLQLCAALKQNLLTAHIPVIFVTSHADSNLELEAFACGAVDFINKPIRPAIVQARVAAQLRIKFLTDALRTVAELDGLTGVGNRRALDECLELEWRRAMRADSTLSAIMIDVDFFKAYNDACGHPAGDDVLRRVASALRQTGRRSGEFVARYGGEEFFVLLPDTEILVAQAQAERVRQRILSLGIEHPASPLGRLLTVSLGVACVQPGQLGENADPATRPYSRLIAEADAALYEAKRKGRNRVVTRGSSDVAGMVAA